MIINIYKYRRVLILIMSLIIVAASVVKLTGEHHNNKGPAPRPIENRYGEYLTWSEVSHLIPKYATFTVIDWETQLKFKVQRRGGSLHADIQPVTAADSAIMKKIYQDHWSWKRRAVLVETSTGRKIAGSMNGMPHGNGAIEGNNFNGHSCIHFRDSKTHGSKKVDLAHQIMVWKAAGVFKQQVDLIDQEDAIRVFFTAMDQGDNKLAARMTSNESAYLLFISFINAESIKVESIEEMDQNTTGTGSTYKVMLLTTEKGAGKQGIRQIIIKTRGKGEGSLIKFDNYVSRHDKSLR